MPSIRSFRLSAARSRACFTVLPAILGMALLSPVFPGSDARAEFPQSPIISSVEWDLASLKATAKGSDLWALAWGSDGHQYTIWGDGGGFGGDDTAGRTQWGVARIEGDASNWRGVNIYGGVDPEASGWPMQDTSGSGIGFKVDSMTAVGNTLVAVMYNWENYPDYACKILHSTDFGKSWKNSDGSPLNSALWDWPSGTDGVGFSPPAFIDMGKGYELSTDGYVYFYRAFEYKALYLGRVPKNSVANRSAYTYRKSDGTWVPDIGSADAVLSNSDISGVNALYHPYLKRYIVTFNSTPGAGRDESRMHDWTMLEGPSPWGPWYKIGEWHDWLDSTYKFQYRISPKWIRDGSEFYLVFSGGAPQFPNTYDWDALHIIRGRFVPASANGSGMPKPPGRLSIR